MPQSPPPGFPHAQATHTISAQEYYELLTELGRREIHIQNLIGESAALSEQIEEMQEEIQALVTRLRASNSSGHNEIGFHTAE
jgi:hypothetical protein